METIVLKRMAHSVRFNRRKLKKVKDIPKIQLNALVDKVELASNFMREVKTNNCMMRFYAFGIAILLAFLILATVRSEKDDSSPGLTREEQSVLTASKLFQNSSAEMATSIFEDEDTDGRNSTAQMAAEESGTGIEDDEKTAQMIAKLLKSLDRENALPRIMLALVIWLITGPVIFFGKKYKDIRVAYRNITQLLNLENELYFCRKGYFWSIDQDVTQLKLIKTHDPSSFGDLDESNVTTAEDVFEEPPRIKMQAIEEKAELTQATEMKPKSKDKLNTIKSSDSKEDTNPTPNPNPQLQPHLQLPPNYMMNPAMYAPIGYMPMNFQSQMQYVYAMNQMTQQLVPQQGLPHLPQNMIGPYPHYQGQLNGLPVQLDSRTKTEESGSSGNEENDSEEDSDEDEGRKDRIFHRFGFK